MGEGAAASRGDRRAAAGARVVTLVALAQLGRGVVPVGHAGAARRRRRRAARPLRVRDAARLRRHARSCSTRISTGCARLPARLGLRRRRATRSSRRRSTRSPPAGELDAALRLLWTAGREGGGEPTGLVLVSTPAAGPRRAARARPSARRRALGARRARAARSRRATRRTSRRRATRPSAAPTTRSSSRPTAPCSRRRRRTSGSARTSRC